MRRAPLKRTGWGVRGTPMKRSRPKPWAEGPAKVRLESACRIRGQYYGLDPHHIVYKFLGGDNVEENCVPLCRTDHRAVHAKGIDLGDYLTDAELDHAAGLLGEQASRNLLWPSENPKRTGEWAA